MLIPLLIAASVLPLTGCFAPAPEPTPTEPPRPPSMAGEWVITRVITDSFTEAEEGGATVGSEGTLYVLFTEEKCSEFECTGSVLSGASLEDRETNASHGTYTNGESGFSYAFDYEPWSDCVHEDGTVVAVDAYLQGVGYSGDVTKVADAQILDFTGTGMRTYAMSDEALDADCHVYSGEVFYDITGVKTP